MRRVHSDLGPSSLRINRVHVVLYSDPTGPHAQQVPRPSDLGNRVSHDSPMAHHTSDFS